MATSRSEAPVVRVIGPDEHARYVDVHLAAFNRIEPAATRAELVTGVDDPLYRLIGAYVDGELVGTAMDYPLELTLPDGGALELLALTWVGVLPTHRRRGVLRALMAEHHAEARRRGLALAGLYATSSAVYGRFGYGVAHQAAKLALDPRHVALPPAAEPRLRLVEPAALLGPAAAVWERVRPATAGFTSRPEPEARWLLQDHEGFAVVAGEDEGYALYAVAREWPNSHGEHVATITELVAATPAAETALWRHVLGLDLVTRVVAEHRPVDDPLRHRIAEPRRVETLAIDDGLWLCPLDVSRVLAARPGLLDALGGIEVDGLVHGGGAAVALDGPTLAMVLLGGASPSSLAAAGRVVERAPGGLARADRAFATGRAPWCPFHF